MEILRRFLVLLGLLHGSLAARDLTCPYGTASNSQPGHCYFLLTNTLGSGYDSKADAKSACNDEFIAEVGANKIANVYPAVINCPDELTEVGNYDSSRTFWLGYSWKTDRFITDDRHSGFYYESRSSRSGYWPWGDTSPALTDRCVVLDDATPRILQENACTGSSASVVCEYSVLETVDHKLYTAPSVPDGLIFVYGDADSGAADAGDTKMDKTVDGNSGSIFIAPHTGFWFFGRVYHKLYVNANGQITFNDGNSDWTPDTFPISSPPTIAPFWVDNNIRNGGDIFYRALFRDDDEDLFELVDHLICTSGLVDNPEPASWMFITTWDHVAFYGSDAEGCITNTYQAVLISDEADRSFVLFNYLDIQWHSAISDYGDDDTGRDGGPATAGFNAGHDDLHYNIPGMNNPGMLDTSSNIGKNGAWIFRVDGDEIIAPEVPTPLCPFGAFADEGYTVLEREDDVEGVIRLPEPFYYFGVNYQNDNLYISENGVLSIHDTASQTTAYDEDDFPTSTAPLIAPFWSDVDTTKAGTVSYRVVDDKADDPELFDKIDDITCQVGAVSNFETDWALVATWRRVAFKGTNVDCDVVNTFQAILARDDIYTHAIFHYNGTAWASGTVDGGNADTGLGGKPAHVGFNAGDETNFYYLPEFYSDDVIELEDGSNVETQGRWAFRIDDSTIGGPTGPLLKFKDDKYTVWEFEENVEVTVTRSGGCTPVAANIKLNVVPDGTNATEGLDFPSSAFDVFFDADDTEGKVNISFIDDTIVEDLEVIHLSIDPLDYGTAVSPDSTRICIKDNDVLNVFSLENSHYEINEASGGVIVTILREITSTEPDLPAPGGSVVLRTMRKSATDAADFAVINDKRIDFDPGQNVHRESVFLLDDVNVEPDEYLMVLLLDPYAGILGDITEAAVTIYDDDSTFSIQVKHDPERYSAYESEGPVEITVLRDGDLTQFGSVRLRLKSGTANPGEDYPMDVITVPFPPGETSATANVKITNDDLVETPFEEMFIAELVTPHQGTLKEPIQTEVLIIDDDSSFSFSSGSIRVDENDERVPITIVREGNPNREATVYLKTVAEKRKRRQATPGNDFVPVDGLPVTFQIGQTSRTVYIDIGDDNTPESLERFRVVLYVGDDDINNQVGDVGIVEVSIYDDEIPQDYIRLDSDFFCAFESEGRVTIPINREGQNLDSCSVRLSTRQSGAGIRATSGSDYTPVNELIQFPPGTTSVNTDVEIANDNNGEDIESFEVVLDDVVGCEIHGTTTATVDIYDNDSAGRDVHFRLSRPVFEVLESKRYVKVKVIRLGDLHETVSVYIRTVNNADATPSADYTPVADSRITFDSGQQSHELRIYIANDGIVEGSESFHVELFNPSGGILDDENSAAEVVIIDDDYDGDVPESIFNFEQARVEILESSREVKVTILRENYLLQTSYVTVSSESVAGNGASSSDYNAISSRRIEFAPGVSKYVLVVAIVDDSTQESREAFRLRLSQPTNAVLGHDDELEIHIIDDDSTFTMGDYEYETYEDVGNVRVSVTRTGYDQCQASVRIESAYIANEAGQGDFEPVYETLIFHPGRDFVHVDIRIRNDEIAEDNEDFQLSLSNPVNGSLGNPSLARVVIYDDDSADGSGEGGDSTAPLILGIVGAVAGVIVLIIVIALAIFCFWALARAAQRPISSVPPGYGGRPAYRNRAYEGYY